MHTRRSVKARVHRRTREAQTPKEKSLYGYRWQKERLSFLREHPLCVAPRCTKVANEVDHIEPHKGKLKLFWDRANWQALCKSCHSSKTAKEDGGFGRTVSLRPRWLKPSLVPVTIISGPPGSGKTTYARKNAGPRDMVIDLDEIVARVARLPWYRAGPEWLEPAIRERNKMLGSLSYPRTAAAVPRVWFIVSEPKQQHRNWWRNTLQADRVVVLATPPDVCLARIAGDARRQGTGVPYDKIVAAWWRRCSTASDEEVIRW